MRIGIYSVSSQSGRAYLADFLSKGYEVYGYARTSDHGRAFVDALTEKGGITLERPANSNKENNSFLAFRGESGVGHSLERLITFSDVIFIALPSNHLLEAVRILRDAGITQKRIPLITAPPRSFATPYLWKILGHMYPIVCFSTCPYSCKAPKPDVAYIKRRKRTWHASLEGSFKREQVEQIVSIFPQAVFNSSPVTTTLSNIGAVFHPATYLLNYEAIQQAQQRGETFSFYMDGIYKRKDVGAFLEKIDAIRLQIAQELNIKTFGMKDAPNEEEWERLTKELYDDSLLKENDLKKLHEVRHDILQEMGDAVVSAQHWLDYTYGVRRIKNESLSEAIGRTPTYQKMSVPQLRYVSEDIPSSLVPLAAFAKRLGIDSTPMDEMIKLSQQLFLVQPDETWRTLEEFSTQYLVDYLRGKFYECI